MNIVVKCIRTLALPETDLDSKLLLACSVFAPTT